MKTIILCEAEHHYHTVYAPVVRDRLTSLTDCDCALYRKADVLADPAKFADTEYIFSTWGMPAFTEEGMYSEAQFMSILECLMSSYFVW